MRQADVKYSHVRWIIKLDVFDVQSEPGQKIGRT